MFQDNNSIKSNIAFAIKKVKALYPIHCITFVMAMIVYWDNQRLDSTRHIIIWWFKVLANFLLLQSCFPKAEFYFSFNAVSWYLSTSVVLYFAFPYIQKTISRIKTRRGIIIQFVVVIVIQIIISASLLLFNNQINNVPVTISDDLTKYVTYICPLYRMGDFYIGCLLGCVFLYNDSDMTGNKITINLIEILSIVLIGFLQLIYNKRLGFLGTDAFRYTLLYTLDVTLLIYIVGLRKGFLSKYVLSSKPMILIGNLSRYAFLIHQLIIVVVRRIFETYIKRLSIIALLSFVITLVLAWCLKILKTKKESI